MDKNPFKPFLERRGHAVLDGGLGTELEASGHDIGDAFFIAGLGIRHFRIGHTCGGATRQIIEPGHLTTSR